MGLLSLKDEILNFEVLIEGEVKLHYYENLLKSFNEWTSFKREIKISSLLENKRIQFDIEEIYKRGTIWGIMTSNPKNDINIKDSCFSVRSMRFIIKDDDVEKLSIEIVPLSTDNGNTLKQMIESNIEIVIKQRFEENEILYFYIELPKKAA